MGITCSRCFTDNPSNFRFCDNCGSSLPTAALQPANMPPPAPAPVNAPVNPVPVSPVPVSPVPVSPLAAGPVPSERESLADASTFHAEPIHSEPIHGQPILAEPIHGQPILAEPIHAGIDLESTLSTDGPAIEKMTSGANLADMATILVGHDLPGDQPPPYEPPISMAADRLSGSGTPAPGLGAPPSSGGSIDGSILQQPNSFAPAEAAPSLSSRHETVQHESVQHESVQRESVLHETVQHESVPLPQQEVLPNEVVPYEPIDQPVIPYQQVAEELVTYAPPQEHMHHTDRAETSEHGRKTEHLLHHELADAEAVPSDGANATSSYVDVPTNSVIEQTPSPHVPNSTLDTSATDAMATDAMATDANEFSMIGSPPIPSVPTTESSSPNTVILRPGDLAALLNRTARLVPRLFGTITEERSIRIDGPVSIGRFDPASGPVDIDLTSFAGAEHVTKRHGFVEPGPNGWAVRDNNSTNGIYVRRAQDTTFGPRITGALELFDGDEISFANVSFIFRTTP